MDPNTLPMYVIAAGLSFSLSLLLMAFAHLQSGTLLVRRFAAAILVLSVAFFAAGNGPLLPTWMTVVGTNVLLLSAGIMFHSGFAAFYSQRQATHDWVGLGILTLSTILFWYWGVVNPNGVYRSIVFSLATVLITGRSAVLLLRQKEHKPVVLLGGLFTLAAIWMFGRAIVLLGSEPAISQERGANPTTWITVFSYIILISLITVSTLWQEVRRLKDSHIENRWQKHPPQASSEPMRLNLMLLWSVVLVLCLAIVSELGIAYASLKEKERSLLKDNAKLANDAFVEHSIQVVNQVDILLRAARGYYQLTRSVPDTERYVAGLGFDKKLIDNIYLIDAEGRILIPWTERSMGRSAIERDYFEYHRQNSLDQIYIGAVQTGQVTGKKQFRLTRRINNPDGSFAGVVLAPLEPSVVSSYYKKLVSGDEGVASLVGMVDHKIRARIPEPAVAAWDTPLKSRIWDELEKAPEGSYQGQSFVDNVSRQYVYKKVSDLPLVMITGFSESDVHAKALERIRPIVFGAALALMVILVLAMLLASMMRRREEQDRFMTMLSHELKTPLSVIRMTMGSDVVSGLAKDRIKRAVTEMNAIIERCLHADRLQNNLIVVRPEHCEIQSLIGDVLQTSVAPERVKVTEGEMPPIKSDAQLIRIVLGNLVDNALKYGAVDGTVNISATRKDIQGRHGISIEVINTIGNSGLPEQKQLFQKYYRAPGAHGHTGSGLGLYIAAGFAKKLGGKLRYHPMQNEVKFDLWLPL